MSGESAVQIARQDGVTVVSLGAEYANLDEDNLHDVSETLLQTARNADPPSVVIDLSHTDYFGTAFLGVVFRAWNRLRQREGGQLALSNPTPYCARILRVTHLNGLWDVYDSTDSAVASLSEA